VKAGGNVPDRNVKRVGSRFIIVARMIGNSLAVRRRDRDEAVPTIASLLGASIPQRAIGSGAR